MRPAIQAALLVLATTALDGCTGEDTAAGRPTTPSNPSPVAPPPPMDVDTHYATKCATCHGVAGKGDGPVAKAGLPVSVRDWTDVAWQASVTDEFLAAVIRDGGKPHGLSELMPSSRTIEDDRLAALVAKIRAFGER